MTFAGRFYLRVFWPVAIGLTLSLALTGMLAAQQPLASEDERGALSPEVQRVQQALGGSALNKFPLLQKDAATDSPRRREPVQHEAIKALREAASQLDVSANRLERLELYRPADALRQQAQQLRLDARELSGPDRQSGEPRALRPWEWGHAEPTRPAELPRSARPVDPQKPPTPTPSLQPTPQPE